MGAGSAPGLCSLGKVLRATSFQQTLRLVPSTCDLLVSHLPGEYVLLSNVEPQCFHVGCAVDKGGNVVKDKYVLA